MHHALEIQEVLLNIFNQRDEAKAHNPQLAILARTCRMFKDPALDLLWEDLHDLSPLARCLPDATRQVCHIDRSYAFIRSLTQTEWETLQSYTCRVRRIHLRISGLGRKSIRIISEHHTLEPLFQNLHQLRFTYSLKTAPLLRLRLPSIISLDITFSNPYALRKLLNKEVVSNFSTICDLSIRLVEHEILEARSLSQMACTPLTQLELHLGTTFADQIVTSDAISLFPHLLFVLLRSQYLPPISLLLSHSRMPAIVTLRAFIREPPSRQDAFAFLSSVCGIGSALRELSLSQISPRGRKAWSLAIQDLQPCMELSNLRHIHWDIDCQVNLTDYELITLASAWPHLEYLVINATHGWNTPGGITPDGLVRLLKASSSLNGVALAVDTRGFVHLPRSELDFELPSSRQVSIDIVDSTIEEASVPTIATFFAHLSPHVNPLKPPARVYSAWRELPSQEAHLALWRDVYRRIESAVSQQRDA